MKPDLEVCDTCEKEITNPEEVMYPWGHHGEPVQCLSCYSGACDAVYETMKDRGNYGIK